jgi:hypothetical protein
VAPERPSPFLSQEVGGGILPGDVAAHRGVDDAGATRADTLSADHLPGGPAASGRSLMCWRPVPSFEPSAGAFAPSLEMVALQRAAMADAVAAGQLGPEADSVEAVCLVSTLIVGVLSQAMAHEPDLEWGQGRFTPTFPRLMKLLVAAYPPPASEAV